MLQSNSIYRILTMDGKISDYIQNEEDLVKKAQKDKKYFGVLYENYKDKIEAYIVKKVSSKDIAEDLASRVFEKAFSKISLFKWKGVSFGCWLFRIARNTVYDYYRVSKRNKRSSLREDIVESNSNNRDLEESVLYEERERELFKVISNLDVNDQYLVYFKYFEGISTKEIAKRTEMSESNVATRLHRIRKKMKDLLD